MRLEHLHILLSKGVLQPVPQEHQGTTVVKFLGSLKLYVDFQLCRDWCP